MNILIGVGIIVVVLALTQLSLLKTLLLIAKVSPYEQKGTDGKSLLILGDSTGYGTGASESKYSIAGLIGSEYPTLTIINNSKNTRTIGELRSDIKNLEGTYDVILLQIGANDILQERPQDRVLEDLRVVLDALAPRTKKIVMISSSNVGGAARFKNDKKAAYFQEQSIDFGKAFLAFNAERPYFTYVDLYVAPEYDPFVLEPHIYTANDELHPTNAGYVIWYKTLKPVLRTALEE